MKKVFLPLLALLLLFPAAADAYSFRTESFVNLREMVVDLEDSEDEETTEEEKSVLRDNLATAVELAQTSINAVRDEELARLDAAYEKATKNLNTMKEGMLERRQSAINRWCVKAKRGKTEKQKAAIQKVCDKRTANAEAGVEKWAKNKLAAIEKKFGQSSRARTTLARGYQQFSGFVVKYNTRGENAINARPVSSSE